MENPDRIDAFGDLDIGDEQVTSNECWDGLDAANELADERSPEYQDVNRAEAVGIFSALGRVYQDVNLGAEQVTSNECYQEEE